MRDPDDPRPDDTYFYTLGQTDTDIVVEGYNERDDESESSDDLTHLWHRHDSFRRNIIGSFPHMWQALTIDMGWTVAEWRQSLEDEVTASDNWNDAVIEVTASTAARLSTPTRPVQEGDKRSGAALLQHTVINSDDAAARTEEVIARTGAVAQPDRRGTGHGGRTARTGPRRFLGPCRTPCRSATDHRAEALRDRRRSAHRTGCRLAGRRHGPDRQHGMTWCCTRTRSPAALTTGPTAPASRG